MELAANTKVAFEWEVSVERDGLVLWTERVKNLVPTEGLNHLLGVTLKGAGQQSTWYIGVFEGNYTPSAGVTAATIVANSTESTAYDEANRPTWVGGSVTGGAVSNADSPAEFTFNDTKTIYGGFLVSSSTKGGGGGSLLSVVRFSTAKALEATDVLKITAGITAVSA
jgi:hypothetical protein